MVSAIEVDQNVLCDGAQAQAEDSYIATIFDHQLKGLSKPPEREMAGYNLDTNVVVLVEQRSHARG